jgi:hypothetical protein
MHGPDSTPSYRIPSKQAPTSGRPSQRIFAKQIPVDAGKVTEIWLDVASSTFTKVVVMNDQTVGSWDDDTEYWYSGTSTSIEDVTEIDLGSQAGNYNSTQITSFIGGLSQAFLWTQNIGTGGWTSGTHTPTEDQARLYEAVDPDDNEKKIGLLIEQDSSNNLRAVTWYKQSNTGKIFNTTPESLTFTLVLDDHDEPSTDPQDIESGTWYYAHSGD